MNKQGFSSIIAILADSPSTPAQIRGITGLSKSNIKYHLDNLLKLKFVSKEGSQYYLDTDPEFDAIILGHLIYGETLDKLAKKIIEDAKKRGANDTLKIFCKVDADNKQKKPGKDLLEKLTDLLKIFRSQGLIILSSSHPRFTIYRLSWKGCMILNLCHVCKKKIDFTQKNFIMQSVDGVRPLTTNATNIGKSEWIEQNSPLIHVGCLRFTTFSSVIEIKNIPKDAVCYHCGLPLSKKLLHDWYFGSSELNILLNLLTTEETSNLYLVRDMLYAEQLREKFWGIDFTGAIISSPGPFEYPTVNVSFDARLATKLAEELRKRMDRKEMDDDDLDKELEGIAGNVVHQLFDLGSELGLYSDKPNHKYVLNGIEIKPQVSPESYRIPNLSAVNQLLTLSGDGIINYSALKKISIQQIFEKTPGPDDYDLSNTRFSEWAGYKRTLAQNGIENAFDIFSRGEEGMGKIFHDERIGSIVYSQIRFRISDIDERFGSFFGKISSRAKELFKEWKNEHLVKLEKFEHAVSDLSTGGHQLGASAYELHSELTSRLPQPNYKQDASGPVFSEYSERTRGYSFIQIDVLGNRYHPLCYDIQFPDDTREPKEVYDGSKSRVEPIKNEEEAKNIE